jgi:hypothetical protein
LEAARVAFLVDGDAAGQALKKQLVKAGIDKAQIVTSSAEYLELLVDGASYLRAANAEMKLANPGETPEMTALDPAQRWPAIDKWCKKNKLNTPSKIAIAARLTEMSDLKLSSVHVEGLRRMHKELVAVLGL